MVEIQILVPSAAVVIVVVVVVVVVVVGIIIIIISSSSSSDRLSYIVLRGRWRNIIVVNVHAPNEEKSDEAKDRFYEELEQVFNQFPKYHMKMLLGDFNAKVGRENIFKATIGQKSLHQDSNDNGVRLVNFATSQNLVVKSNDVPSPEH